MLKEKNRRCLGGKSGKKGKKKKHTTNSKISHFSLSNLSYNASLSLSRITQARQAGTAVLFLSRHSQASFSLSLITLSGAALSVSSSFFDHRHLPPLIIIVSISLLSITHSHFLFQSIAPHHWLCDCRFLLLTVDSCSWISLLLLIFMRVLWVLCWVYREVSFLGS